MSRLTPIGTLTLRPGGSILPELCGRPGFADCADCNKRMPRCFGRAEEGKELSRSGGQAARMASSPHRHLSKGCICVSMLKLQVEPGKPKFQKGTKLYAKERVCQ